MKKNIYTLFILLFLFACSESNETKSKKYVYKADALFEQQNFTKAALEYKNALQVEPANTTALLKLAETYLKLEDPKNAYISYSRVLALDPENTEAQLKVASFYFLMKRFDDARKNVDLVLKKEPFNTEALMIQAGLLIGDKDFEEAEFVLNRIIRQNPKESRPYLTLAQILASQGKNDKAEELFKQAMKIDAEAVNPKIALFAFYQHVGKEDPAMTILSELKEKYSDDPGVIQLLADYSLSKGDIDEAETRLKSILEKNPQNKQAFLKLTRLYESTKRYDDLVTFYQQAYESAEENTAEKMELGLQLTKKLFILNRDEEADKLLKGLIEKDPNNSKLRLLEAEHLIKKKQFSQAITQLDQLLEDAPNTFVEVKHTKALALLGAKDIDAAKKVLEELLAARPDYQPSQKLLSKIYLNTRDYAKAVAFGEQILERDPNNLEALKMIGASAVLSDQLYKARPIFERIAELSPENTDSYQALGLLHMRLKEPKQAIESFEKVLEINPSKLNALQKLVLIYMARNEPEKALLACNKVLQKVQANPRAVASIQLLKGQVHLAKKELSQAEALFEEAIKTAPNMQEGYFFLARLNMERYGKDRAIEEMEVKIKENPEQPISHLLIANMYDLEGQHNKSEPHYRKVIALRPDYIPAFNNLAYTLAEQNKDLDQALKYALTAKEKLGENVQVLDTLGWVYTRRGETDQAIELLLKALELDAENPSIQYHLGVAYIKSNQLDLARKEFEIALRSEQHFPEKERAKKALSESISTN